MKLKPKNSQLQTPNKASNYSLSIISLYFASTLLYRNISLSSCPWRTPK